MNKLMLIIVSSLVLLSCSKSESNNITPNKVDVGDGPVLSQYIVRNYKVKQIESNVVYAVTSKEPLGTTSWSYRINDTVLVNIALLQIKPGEYSSKAIVVDRL